MLSFFVSVMASMAVMSAEMAGGITGVIRRIDIFVQRLARLHPPVQRMTLVCPPPENGNVGSADARECAAENAKRIHLNRQDTKINAEKFNHRGTEKY